MSGTGARFIKAGYSEPKPLIKINGKAIIEHVIALFPGENDYIFICNEFHLQTTKMREILLSAKPNAKIISVKNQKLGPVWAVSNVFDLIDDNEPIIVNYCDFFMDWDYDDFKRLVADNNCDGAVVAYKGFHPHLFREENFYAGMRIDENNYMLEIREKHSFTPNKMDSPQSTGTYYFKKGIYIKEYFQQLMDEKISLNGEYYVSLVYNLLKRNGLNVYVYDKVPHFCQWGTPQDLEEYEYWSEIFQKYQYGKS